MADPMVRHFREILVWPLQLMPSSHSQMGRQWELMPDDATSPWRRRESEFDCDPERFQERHYREFVTFLPYAQRFLYGEGQSEAENAGSWGRSPLHVYRRHDIRFVRMTFRDGAELDFQIAHIDLYFFFDIDIVILALEIMADDVPLSRVEDAMFRFGRAFPAQWDADGQGNNCLTRVAWLDIAKAELAGSDFDDRTAFLAHVGQYRSTRMAAHLDYLLRPLVPHHSDEDGAIRYRQLEYHRMPLMAYLALDDPFALDADDFYRLGMVAPSSRVPLAARELARFEAECCYDRFWAPSERHESASTRLMCNGHAFVQVGLYDSRYFTDAATGVLGQFRHQHFLLVLVAHFHKAALLMFSDRMAAALSDLNVRDAASVKRFKRVIRLTLETFLRFNQRYWFREMSNQPVAAQLFAMLRQHLDTERQYTDVRESVQSMNQYLENDDLRRQADTVVRLTVVTILSMIGATVTGLLGMNLLDEASQPFSIKLLVFFGCLVPVGFLAILTVMKSRQLSEFLDVLADQRSNGAQRFEALRAVFRKPRR
ncbi:hypothetical protein ACTSKR_05110 [Chitinibacteraceae bacterium HSL-7]